MAHNDVFEGAAPDMTEELARSTSTHPCYSIDAHHKYARMHLPVAPRCNISCNYCNRRYDCVNESRPGVTSEVLGPDAALAKFIAASDRIPALSVVGIAGPGDALANWYAVRRTIELVKAESPETVFCLSTNGLMLPRYAGEIVDLGVKHVTVTVNCVDPAIGAKIYGRVAFEGAHYTGEEGALLLIRNQLQGIELLARRGALVKVNVVMIKGINDEHIPEVVRKVKSLGAFMANIMPLIPAPGSAFEEYPQTNRKEVDTMRNLCKAYLPQMRHCRQCRADAIGLLSEDRSHEFRDSQGPGQKSDHPAAAYKVAVTSKYGTMVDLHYGHAERLHVYEVDGVSSRLLEIRDCQKYCHGVSDCDEAVGKRRSAVESVSDCDAVLTMRIGYEARKRLKDVDVSVVEACVTIEDGLSQAYRQLSCGELKRASV